jgi:hypothetical protein
MKAADADVGKSKAGNDCSKTLLCHQEETPHSKTADAQADAAGKVGTSMVRKNCSAAAMSKYYSNKTVEGMLPPQNADCDSDDERAGGHLSCS